MILEITVYKRVQHVTMNTLMVGSVSDNTAIVEKEVSSGGVEGLVNEITELIKEYRSFITKVEIVFVKVGIEKVGTIFSTDPVENFAIKGMDEEEKEEFLEVYFKKMKPD